MTEQWKNPESDLETDREVVNCRIFDASREQIFHAFREPELLAQWWGPKGFRNTIHQFEWKEHGLWHYTMHGPDGTDYENRSKFVEIYPHERIVIRHLEPGHAFQLSITLSDHQGKTNLTWRMLFDTVQEYEKAAKFVHEGNEQNLDRLEQLLAEHRTA